MRSKRSWMLPVGLLLLASLVGCPNKTPTTPPDSNRVPLPGCHVERLEDAEQAVRHVSDSDAYVFKIDGWPPANLRYSTGRMRNQRRRCSIP
jgi:predicted small lipoprotein YifL